MEHNNTLPYRFASWLLASGAMLCSILPASTAYAEAGSIQSANWSLVFSDWQGSGPTGAISGTVTCSNGVATSANVVIPGTGAPGAPNTVTFNTSSGVTWSRPADGKSASLPASSITRNGNTFNFKGNVQVAPHPGPGTFSGQVVVSCPVAPTSTPTPTPTPIPARGGFAASCTAINGWTCAAQYPQPLAVHIYIDGAFVDGTTANIDNKNAGVAGACGGSSAREFLYSLPQRFVDGKKHTVQVFAIGPYGVNPPLYTGSGAQTVDIQCSVPPTVTPTPTPSCPNVKPVEPIAECVQENGDGTFTAYFGYNNQNSQDVELPLGYTATAANYFAPGLARRGQPTTFKPGRATGVFRTTFDGTAMHWALQYGCQNNARFAEVSSKTKRCAPVKPIVECIDVKPSGTLARFGYQNPNAFEIAKPIGAMNTFRPEPADRAQPTSFLSGRFVNVFSVPLVGDGLTWKLDSIEAVANQKSPLCSPNKAPTCGITPSSLSCDGTSTKVTVDGSASADPDGFPVALTWSTSCANGAFDSATSTRPTLTLPALKDGQNVQCKVSLKVDDGRATTSCSAPITGTCSVDCNGTPGGTAVVDRCGVCGGNNACIDCKGVVNGTAQVDICGVCGGDGTSCLGCISNDYSTILGTLDADTVKAKANVLKLAKRVSAVSKASKQVKKLVAQARKDAASLQDIAWTSIWQFPVKVQNCTNTSVCSQSSLVDVKTKIVESIAQLRNLQQKLVRQLKKASGRKLSPNDAKIATGGQRIFDSIDASLAELPDYETRCE